MVLILLIFLLFPLTIQASCTDNVDSDYDLAVSQGDYVKAFSRVAQDLHLSAEDKSHFDIIPGYSRSHDDRHGQADPDTLQVHLDPDLFGEGKEGACQGIAHELTHLRQFRRDRSRLHAYFSTHSVPESGWSGCDREVLNHPDSNQEEEEAYSCLEDNSLATHAAAEDIEAVLAQIPFASNRTLRDDDFDYLVDNLKNWADSQSMLTNHSNESYYLPEIKKEDIHQFCMGVHYAHQQKADIPTASAASLLFCGRRN
jgi:hypothetical protein